MPGKHPSVKFESLGFLFVGVFSFVCRERAQKDLGAILDSVSVCFGRCDFLFELYLVC
jgi:hypothetical protein